MPMAKLVIPYTINQEKKKKLSKIYRPFDFPVLIRYSATWFAVPDYGDKALCNGVICGSTNKLHVFLHCNS